MRPPTGTTPVSIDAGGHRANVRSRRNELAEAHLYMVAPIARGIHKTLPPSFELDDLISTGYLGLLHAATQWLPGRHGGTPFHAFAQSRIRGAILDSVRRRHYREATHEEIPTNMQVPFADPFAERTIAEATEQSQRQKDRFSRPKNPLTVAIQRLTSRERAVLGVYYAENCMSIAQVGQILGLSEHRVTLEHDAAVAKLRLRLAA